MPEIGEAVVPPAPPVSPCDHSWVEIESKSPEEGKKQIGETAAKVKLSDPPSESGYLFEIHCIDKNMTKLLIEKVSVKYKCVLCNVRQEVDIVGKDQIAECKNKKKADLVQAARLKDIQSKTKGGGVPLAKINESHDKSASLDKTYKKAGLETELVAGFP